MDRDGERRRREASTGFESRAVHHPGLARVPPGTSLSAGQQAASVGAGGMKAIRRASANRGAGAEPVRRDQPVNKSARKIVRVQGVGGDKLRKKARAVPARSTWRRWVWSPRRGPTIPAGGTSSGKRPGRFAARSTWRRWAWPPAGDGTARPAGSIPAAFVRPLSFFSFVAPRKDGVGARYRPGYMARSSNGKDAWRACERRFESGPRRQHDERRRRAWRLQLICTTAAAARSGSAFAGRAAQ